MRPRYETRNDGWPLCPVCGEDELYSLFYWDGEGERPPMQAWLDGPLSCYRCGYDSTRPVAIGGVSSAIAAAIIQRRLDEGKDITIPSLDVIIPGKKTQ